MRSRAPARSTAKLANQGFLAKAADDVVASEREKQTKLTRYSTRSWRSSRSWTGDRVELPGSRRRARGTS